MSLGWITYAQLFLSCTLQHPNSFWVLHLQDPTPSKDAGYAYATITKAIEYDCATRPSNNTPWGLFHAMLLVKVCVWRRCHLFPELLGDLTQCLTGGYWVLLTTEPNNVKSCSVLQSWVLSQAEPRSWGHCLLCQKTQQR